MSNTAHYMYVWVYKLVCLSDMELNGFIYDFNQIIEYALQFIYNLNNVFEMAC